MENCENRCFYWEKLWVGAEPAKIISWVWKKTKTGFFGKKNQECSKTSRKTHRII